MPSPKRRRKWPVPNLPLLTALIVLLAVGYVLSIGPAIALHEARVIRRGSSAFKVVTALYEPLEEAKRRSEFYRVALDRYVSLWSRRR